MKRILLLGLLVIVGTAFVCGGVWAYLLLAPQASSEPVTNAAPPASVSNPPLRPPVDVDALAARMKDHQDVYQRISSESLAAYAKRHPGQHPYDDLAKMTLKLASYLWVWDDFYREGLRRDLDNYADHLDRCGCPDQIWGSLQDIDYFADRYSNNDENAAAINHCADVLAETEYPAAFKFESYRTCVKNIVCGKTDAAIKPPLKTDALPPLIGKAVQFYQELIKEHIPDDILFDKGDDLLSATQDDETSLKAASMGLDRAFTAEDRQNSTANLLDGEFYVDFAWNARGSNEANTVTQEGWQLFGSRLEQADQIVSDLYAKHPENTRIANVMMTVVLGRQQPRDQMELWFQRGIQADPNNFHLYMQKRWYLLPRWYGSDQDVWNFGMECAGSDNWSGKVPIILAEAITDAATQNPQVYSQPEIWTPLEKVYRAYLEHYPNSSHYRSLFAKCAVEGKHWDVAKEQFKILGDDWDRDVFETNQYADMTELTALNVK